jgi:hypothetical protein
VVDYARLWRRSGSRGTGTGTGTGTLMDTQRQISTVIGANCIDFESQDELHFNFDPTLLYLMTSMRGKLWWIVAYERVTWD